MLDKKQIKRLKEQAHFLKPLMNIGKEGFSQEFTRSLLDAFNTKELIKIKYLDNSAETKDTVKAKIKKLHAVELVYQIGHTFVLYKPLDKDK